MADARYALIDLAGEDARVQAELVELAAKDAVRRMWAKDPALWKPNPAQQQEIMDRLGWLTLPTDMQSRVHELQQLVEEVRAAGIQHVVLCGMGGSSLAPDVFRQTFGTRPGFPELLVLDSTDPGAVRLVDQTVDPARTLFLISSKSGGTIEVQALLAHFWERAGADGSRFCAITDPGTSLASLATERGFRRVFLNLPDIGGRYSALSLFGLVPAALIGVDVSRLLTRAAREMEASSPENGTADNPGAWLGAMMAGLARAGRDKLTLLTSPAIGSFGLWLEQLIAESLGKEGRGIVPVVGEPRLPGADELRDRAFVALRVESDASENVDRAVALLAGHVPVVETRLEDAYDLGAEMYRWEVATALAGALLGIHPFDQPNVQESKDNTGRVLQELQASGALPDSPADAVFGPDNADALERFLRQARRGDYLALQAYVTPTSQVEDQLQALRAALGTRVKVATSLGFGPRFLHSTGQLHKGGPPTGLFLQVTYTPVEDVSVPGQPYSFGTLLRAQALGDLRSLQEHGLRAARVELGPDLQEGLGRLAQTVQRIAASSVPPKGP